MLRKYVLLRQSSLVWWLIYLIPVIVLIGFIAKFSVNVPLLDDWNLVDTFYKKYESSITLKDLFAQHNEHRIFFPRLIFIPLAFFSDWNVKYGQYCNVLLTFITLFSIARLALGQTEHSNKFWVHVANFLTSALLFSVFQTDTWVLSFQLTWLLINTCIAIAVFFASTSPLTIASFSAATFFCLVASFSSAHGLVSWIAVSPCIFYSTQRLKRRFIRTGLWGGLCLVSGILYFVDYHKPDYHPGTLYFLAHPWVATRYFFTLLGGSLIRSFPWMTIAGFILLIAFFYYVIRILKHDEQAKLAAPWLSLGLFSIVFALITTIGRAGFGVEHAIASRYTSSSVFLIIAIIQLFRLSLYSIARDRAEFNPRFKRIFQIVVCTTMGLILANSVKALSEWQLWAKHKLHRKTCLELIHYMDESHFEGEAPNSCLRLVFPSTQALRGWVTSLEEIGFRDFPQDLDFVARPSVELGAIEKPDPKDPSFLLANEEGKIKISGWAKLPDDSNSFKLILLSANDRKQFFASVPINEDSPDLDDESSGPNEGHYRGKKWSADIVIEALPPDIVKIGAWIYNPTEKQFVKLNGELAVSTAERS